MALHQAQEKQGTDNTLEPKRQASIETLRKEAAPTREFFLAATTKRRGSKGQELKSNVTDTESAEMATSKGVMQGYAAQAEADSASQVQVKSIIAADTVKIQTAPTPLLQWQYCVSWLFQ